MDNNELKNTIFTFIFFKFKIPIFKYETLNLKIILCMSLS